MNPYVIIGALLLAIASYFGGHHQGGKASDAKWQKRELQHAEAYKQSLKAEIDKRTTDQLKYNRLAKEASDEHHKNVTNLKRDAAADLAAVKRSGGLRIPASACTRTAAAGTEAAGAGGSDEASAGTIRLPERIENDLFALTQKADETSEQLRALQKWVIDNGFYGP